MEMINPLLKKGRFLFVLEGCDHCQIYKKFIRQINMELKPDKRIQVIDCTSYNLFGISDNPLIELFERYFDGFPTLFIEGGIKSGANTVEECKAWINARLFNDFEFPKEPEYLPILRSYATFDKSCKYYKGRLICN